MGGKNVKNTIVERVMQHLAPHPCSGCGKVGSLLCQYCKYDIVSEPFVGCFACGRPNLLGICQFHDSPIQRVFIVGRRIGALKVLIDNLKFHNVKVAARTAAELLHESLPILPPNTVIVPVPTVASHIRQRGYDQVALIARHFAQLRSLEVSSLLKRHNKATQHKLGRAERVLEARQAFVLDEKSTVQSDYYLLLDDIITTGSTVTEAARVLSRAGGSVIVAALAYQPLD